MTPQAKRERRMLKHELQNQARRVIARRVGLFTRPAQLTAMAKRTVDIVIKERTTIA